MNIGQKFEQRAWRLVYPIFKWGEHLMLPFHQKQRQKYHIGWLHPKKSLASLKQHLSGKWGFGNHFVAWEDSNQILSWRKLTSFDEQYHIRVFKDGEIRGHYEATPEGAPYKHFFEKGEQPKRADFLKFLDGYIVFQKYSRLVGPDTTVPDSNSEIIFLDSQEKA